MSDSGKASKKGLAEALGVSLKTIKDAHKKGRISGEMKENGHWEFDIEECRKALKATSTAHKLPQSRTSVSEKALQDSEHDESSQEGEEGSEDKPKWDIAAARLERETYLAKMAKLDYEKEQGNLIDAEMVKREFEDIAIKVQKGILAIVPRVSAIAAAETDEFVVQKLLREEFTLALRAISNGIKLVTPS